jgi:hypothetical protein
VHSKNLLPINIHLALAKDAREEALGSILKWWGWIGFDLRLDFTFPFPLGTTSSVYGKK